MGADNAKGIETLQGWIDRLKGLSPHVKSQGPQVVAELAQASIAEACANGTSVDGYKWAPRLEDGARAFANAAKYVTVKIVGSVVLVQLLGPVAIAQFGTGKMRARPLMPIGGLRAGKLGEAIRKGLIEMGVEWMTRKGRHGSKAGRMWK